MVPRFAVEYAQENLALGIAQVRELDKLIAVYTALRTVWQRDVDNAKEFLAAVGELDELQLLVEDLEYLHREHVADEDAAREVVDETDL